jgi:hypothetical protein
MSRPLACHGCVWAPALLLLAVATAQAGLRFESELIRLEIRGDTLRVDGIYRLEATSPHEPVLLFYPYPVDSLLGEAWTESLAWRPASETDWRPLAVEEEPTLDGVFWRLPLEGNRRVEARTVYGQRLRARYGRYILTTTAAWGRPLQEARFELALPPGMRLVECSYPFARGADGIWRFLARDFMPLEDLLFRWAPGS